MPSTVVFMIGAYAITSGMIAICAIAIVASVVLTKSFAVDTGYTDPAGDSANLGNRQQIPPATDNKLPVIYGSAFVGGTITDLSITENSQTIYYVMSLCEVTSNGADTITFGDVYFGGKKVLFETGTPNVTGFLDQSTGATDTSVAPYIKIYKYSNGSSSVVNTSLTAIEVMQSSGLIYTWDATKLMTNCAFAIIKLTYNGDVGITGMQQTSFQLTNSRSSAGDCFYDYFTNESYGAAIPAAQIDTASLTALNTYSNANFTYTDYLGIVTTQPRFKFNGLIDTKRTIMANLQDMSACCDCLIKYNEITSKWGVIVQQPTYTVAMALDDSNIISAITISPVDLAGSYNVVEVKYPNKTAQDSFDSVTYDLAQINPILLFPNEPVNKQSLSLPLCNNDVQAQYLANRFLEAAREDLQVQLNINYVGIQLEAGDIVTITNTNYGWVAKPFRITKVIEEFGDDGSVQAKLTLSEFNSSIYDDANITQFTPADNSGISDPTFFGTIPAPVVVQEYGNNATPLFLVQVTTSSRGIIQYAEVWYSAYTNPTPAQLYFAGTSEIQSSGDSYDINTVLPLISLSNIPAGNWYLFSRMVNSLATSAFSSASAILRWRPSTFQFSDRYLVVAYADTITGTGFSLSPTNKEYYGLINQNNTSPSMTASDYTWYLADPNFGTTIFLAYANRSNRKFSFASGFAGYAAGTGAFVPTQASIFDPSVWSALANGINYIDLDHRTGQLLETGTTTVGTGEIAITNNPDGKVVASLKQYLDFGSGIYQRTQSAATITVDIYGRVVGFEAPDDFYYTDVDFTATAGQTVFSVTRGTGYIVGNCWVLINGAWIEKTQYTDAASTVTLSVTVDAGDIVTIISFKSVSNVSVSTASTSGNGTVATIGFANRATPPFTVGQSITVAGVAPSGYNGTYTVTACDTVSVSYANTTTGAMTAVGTIIFANPYYNSFSINTADLTNSSDYTASGFTLTSGYELLFLNGTIMNDQDYDIIGQTITNFPSITTGKLTILQWTPNNLGIPNGNCVNEVTNTIIGQVTYPFSYDTNAFNLYANGIMYEQEVDYTTGVGGYTLAVTPDTILTTLVNQTFARTGAV